MAARKKTAARKKAPRKKAAGRKVTAVAPRTSRGKRGRPKAQIDVESVAKQVSYGLPLTQVADILGIARSTLYEHIDENAELRDAIERGKATMNRNILAGFWRAVAAGSAPVIIFGLKNHLGWRDAKAIEFGLGDDADLEVGVDLRPVLEEKLAAYVRSRRRRPEVEGLAPTSRKDREGDTER